MVKKVDGILSDNAKYRQKLRSLAGDEEAEGGKGGKQDTATAEIEAMRGELRRERALNKLSAAATQAGFLTPDLILNFVDLDETKFDKNGNVVDADKVVESLKTTYPQMFGKPATLGNGDGAAGGSRNSDRSGDMNSRIRAGARGSG
jgi:hypothetical protein